MSRGEFTILVLTAIAAFTAVSSVTPAAAEKNLFDGFVQQPGESQCMDLMQRIAPCIIYHKLGAEHIRREAVCVGSELQLVRDYNRQTRKPQIIWSRTPTSRQPCPS